jgi:ferredoxin-NADP reductase
MRAMTDIADRMLAVRINQMRYEAETIVSLELVSADGDDLPAFTAGAHVDLKITDAITRSYSLLNDAGERSRYVIAVNRDPNSRGGSVAIHERFRVGDMVTISSPRNNFPLVETAESSVFVAGGIGITPLLCMIRRLDGLRRPWELYYAARTRRTIAFLRELESLAANGLGRVHFNFDGEPGGTVLDIDAIVASRPNRSHVYCCGPTAMLEAFEKAVGPLAPEFVHLEYFSTRYEPAIDGNFELVLSKSNKRLAIPAGKTMLEVMLEAKVNVNYACSQGVCGACLTRVLEGVPDHRDGFLTDEEKAANTQIMVCCSGSKTARLVLEL